MATSTLKELKLGDRVVTSVDYTFGTTAGGTETVELSNLLLVKLQAEYDDESGVRHTFYALSSKV